eukprot:scaffold154_cov185-Alexandrium_tamarense.AAC.13
MLRFGESRRLTCFLLGDLQKETGGYRQANCTPREYHGFRNTPGENRCLEIKSSKKATGNGHL